MPCAIILFFASSLLGLPIYENVQLSRLSFRDAGRKTPVQRTLVEVLLRKSTFHTFLRTQVHLVPASRPRSRYEMHRNE